MSLANRLSLYISLIIIVIFCAIGFLFMQDVAEREERFASLYANVIVDGSVDKLDSEISKVEYHLVNAAPLFENNRCDHADGGAFCHLRLSHNGRLRGAATGPR